MFKRVTLIPLMLLVFSVSMYPSIVTAQITPEDIVKKLISQYFIDVGNETNTWVAESISESEDRTDADGYQQKMTDLLPSVNMAFDNYEFYYDWLELTWQGWYLADSNYKYALSMLEQLSSSSQTNPAAIMYWEGQRDAAYSNRSAAEIDIALLKPIVDEAWTTYDNLQKEYEGYNKKYEDANADADQHLINMWITAGNICNYYRAIIKLYEDNPEKLGPLPQDDPIRKQEKHWDDLCPINDGVA